VAQTAAEFEGVLVNAALRFRDANAAQRFDAALARLFFADRASASESPRRFGYQPLWTGLNEVIGS